MSDRLCKACNGWKPCAACLARFVNPKTKRCPRCNTEKLAEDFNRRRQGRLSSHCKDCNKENLKAFHAARKQAWAAQFETEKRATPWV